MIPTMIGNMASGSVAIRYNAQGPCVPIVTACATGTHSIGEAYRAIKHGYADAVIAEIMHIVWQAFNVGIIQAIIVIACNEDLVFVRQATKPFDEVLYFLFCAFFSDVACMHDHIGFRQIFQLMMLAVSIRDM
jgi:acetyl-CoA acetyltransferase